MCSSNARSTIKSSCMEYERELKDEDCTTSEDQDVQNQKDSLKENPNTFL